MVINTQTTRTIINWSSFSIGKGESVVVNQPGSSSILLDRVQAGGGVSLLFGSLSSNGQLVLINPAGIVVGPGAQITAAQLLLTTHNLSDANFLSGGVLDFNLTGDPGSKVVNRGSLTATSGAAILAGDAVSNSGVIAAELGTVVLGAAKTYTVDFSGDGLLKFAVTAPVDQVAPGAKALVDNSGTLSAKGGTVLLTAAAAKGVIDNVINSSGIVEATSVANVNGQIVLSGSGGATVVSGTLDASGKGAGETGGTVSVTGDTVTLASGATIDVSGDQGGGSAFIGGNFHGAGPLPNAQATTVSQGASIIADAITSGDGGQVAVWSDGTTNYGGSITARGGAQGGNGGSVETSGHGTLFVTGTVDTSAPLGRTGTWLLDPTTDFTVCLSLCSTSGSAIALALSSNEVIIEATTSNTQTAGTAVTSFGASTGNISIEQSGGSITWNSSNQLTLLAENTITVNASIQNSGTGGVNLVAGWNGTAGVTGATFSAATLLASPSNYGNGSSGDIAISGGFIAVGSALGQTTIAARNLTVTANSGMDGAYAAVGYVGSTATGPIQVSLNGNLTLNAGTGDVHGAPAIIGDQPNTGSVSAPITVAVGGTTAFNSEDLGTFPEGATIIGNTADFAASGGTTSGSVSITSGQITSQNQGIENTIGNDLPGGDVSISATGSASTFSVGAGTSFTYGSTHGLSLSAAAETLAFNGTFVNTSTGTVTASAGTIDIQGSIVTTGGQITANGPVVLTGATTLQTNNTGVNGATISVNNTINGLAALTLAAGPSGNVSFGSAIGGTTPIGSLSVQSAQNVFLGGNVETKGGAVVFSAPTVLQSNATIDTTNGIATGGTINFVSTIADQTFNTHTLTLNAGTAGNITFGGDVGSVLGTRPKSLVVTGANNVNNTSSDGLYAGTVSITAGGNLTVGGQISTGIGNSAVNPSVQAGGPLTIDVGGTVTIGANFPGADGNGNYAASLYSGGADAGSVGNTLGLGTGTVTGSGGAISVIAGGTITLYNSASTRGGRTDEAGINGGNAGTIFIDSTGGNVITGVSGGVDRGVTLFAGGGPSVAATGAGAGGNGANITVIGNNITLPRAISDGGDTTSTTSLGGSGGSISITTNGGVLTLYGVGDPVHDATLASRSGGNSSTLPGVDGELDSHGPLTSAGGSITVSASEILLETSTAGADPGATASFASAGVSTLNGPITLNAPIEGAASGAQSLYARTLGGFTVTGEVGDGTPLANITLISSNTTTVGGSASFDGDVTVTGGLTDMSTSAADLQISGFLTASTFTPPQGSSTVELLGGAFVTAGIGFGNTGLTTIAGTITTSTGGVGFTGPVVLLSDTTFDTTNEGANSGHNVTFSGTIDDPASGAGSAGLTIIAGTSGPVTFGAAIGGSTPIGDLQVIDAKSLSLGGKVITAGGIVDLNAATVLTASVTIDATAGGTVPAGANMTIENVDAASPGVQSLTINAGNGTALAELQGTIGGSTPLGGLAVTGASIEVDSGITTLNGPVTLTSIATDASILINSVLISTGTGNVQLTATGVDSASIVLSEGSILTTTGSVSFTATTSAFTDLGSAVIINGGVITTSGGAITATATSVGGNASILYEYGATTGGGPLTMTATATALGMGASIEIGGPLMTGAGAVTLSAVGDYALVTLDYGSGITTTSGAVSLNASAGANDAAVGVEGPISTTLTGGTLTITSSATSSEADITIGTSVGTNGAVTLTASGSTAAQIYIEPVITLTTGNGAVTMTATATATNGFAQVDNYGSMNTGSGSVTLTATSTGGGDDAYIYFYGFTVTGAGTVTVAATATATGVAYIELEEEFGPIVTGSGAVSIAATGGQATVSLDYTTGIATGSGAITIAAVASAGDAFVEISDALSIATGTGAITVSASSTGGFAEIYAYSAVTSAGGNIVMTATALDADNGFAEIIADENLTTNGGAVSLTASGGGEGSFIEATTISTGTGAVNLTATGTNGSDADIYLYSVVTNNAPVTMTAMSTGIGGEASVELEGDEPGASITTGSGNVTLSASGDQATVSINNDDGIVTTSGKISLAATSGTNEALIENDGIISTTLTGGSVTMTATSTADEASIYISGGITTSGAPVTFTANGAVDAEIDLESSISTGGGAVAATAISGTGYSEIYSDGNITTTGGGVTLSATSTSGDAYIYAYVIQTSGGPVTITATATSGEADVDLEYYGTISTGAGAVLISATGGPYGAYVYTEEGFSIATTSGAVTLNATASGYVLIADSGSISTGAAVTLTALSTGGDEADLYAYSGANISTTTAPVMLTATATGSGGNVYLEVDNSIVTQGGSVTISGLADGEAYVSRTGTISIAAGGGTVTVTATSTGVGSDGAYNEDPGVGIFTSGGGVTLTATAASGNAELYTGAVTTNSGSLTATASAAGPSSAFVEADGAINTGAGNVTLFAVASSGYASVFLDGVQTTSGDVVVGAIGTSAGVTTGGTIQTATGNVFIAAAGTGTSGGAVALGGIIDAGGSFTAVAAGTDSILNIGGCGCGNPVVMTNGGSATFDAAGTNSIIDVIDPLTLTGPTILAAQGTIEGAAIDPPTLTVYGTITNAIGGGVVPTLATYGAFPGIQVPGGLVLPPGLAGLIGAGTGTAGQVITQAAMQAAPAALLTSPTVLNGTNIVTTLITATVAPPVPTPLVNIVLPPPPPPLTLTTTTTTEGGQTLGTVNDIDTGGQLFTEIAPGNGGTGPQDPTTTVPPVTPAPQRQAVVQATEAPVGGVGSNIFQTHMTFVHHVGVPGIVEPASMGGNRSLWFGSTGG